jgi:hypothetical protein
MPRPKRYVDDEGFVECPGGEEPHAAHLSEFYTKPLADGWPIWWVNPRTGKEWGAPTTRCRKCSIARQRDRNLERARSKAADALLSSAQRLQALRERGVDVPTDPAGPLDDDDIDEIMRRAGHDPETGLPM